VAVIRESNSPPSCFLGAVHSANFCATLSKVFSAAVCGVDAYDLEGEVSDDGGQKDAIVIVGLPDAAVREARDRVKTAISNSGFRWPGGHVTLNLAPADVKKESPSFDLPIALAMIACAQDVKRINPPVIVVDLECLAIPLVRFAIPSGSQRPLRRPHPRMSAASLRRVPRGSCVPSPASLRSPSAKRCENRTRFPICSSPGIHKSARAAALAPHLVLIATSTSILQTCVCAAARQTRHRNRRNRKSWPALCGRINRRAYSMAPATNDFTAEGIWLEKD
jgi:hypothetical protein